MFIVMKDDKSDMESLINLKNVDQILKTIYPNKCMVVFSDGKVTTVKHTFKEIFEFIGEN